MKSCKTAYLRFFSSAVLISLVHSGQVLAQVDLALTPQMRTGTFQQILDHTDSRPTQTFAQYYWIDTEFASGPSAPVIYHICGEGAVDIGYELADSGVEFAKALGASIVFLEHRYYGKSEPFNDLTSEHLKYLTSENAIEDLATFQRWISIRERLSGKWIAIGGSYAGNLSALYRYVHPELVVGSLASSAIMHMVPNMPTSNNADSFGASYTDFIHNYAIGHRQFLYEGCNTYGSMGWSRGGDSELGNMLGPSSALCRSLFGMESKLDPPTYNEKWFDPFVKPGPHSASNILFTQGEYDGFYLVGVTPDNNNNPLVTTFVIRGGGHHYDLTHQYDHPEIIKSITEAKALFLSLAKRWISQ